MKKSILAMLIAATLVAGCACANNQNTEPADTDAEVNAETEISEEGTADETPEEVTDENSGGITSDEFEETPEETPEEAPADEEPAVQLPIKHDDVIIMMDNVMSYYPGTAGSSLKLYNAAFAVLNLAEVYTDECEELVKTTIAEHISYLSDLQVENMRETAPEIDAIADMVFENGVESMKDMLSDAGSPEKYDEYSPEKYQKVMGFIKDALA